MPSEQTIIEQIAPETPQVQVKLCSHCHAVVLEPPRNRVEGQPLLCARCEEAPIQHHPHHRQICLDSFLPFPVAAAQEHNVLMEAPLGSRPQVDTIISTPLPATSFPNAQATDPPHSVDTAHATSALHCPSSSSHTPSRSPSRPSASLPDPHPKTPHHVSSHRSHPYPSQPNPHTQDNQDTSYRRFRPPGRPDPLLDITRLRVRSQNHHCLYPGAVFQGTQKSGRNSYDVSVTILVSGRAFASVVLHVLMRTLMQDVNLPYFLCGYLRIRGLTDDWPELTTYFDAEIIGSRHGFLTQKWGADENADMSHWNRFPAFKRVKGDMARPGLTISDRDRGVVFMRWKEKFLVPDHRVQDVNGASFAGMRTIPSDSDVSSLLQFSGFYYVCVDFNPSQNPASPTKSEFDMQSHIPVAEDCSMSPNKSKRSRKLSVPSYAPRMSAPTATMNGFYYHQNSEP